jgi:hypothetical protein
MVVGDGAGPDGGGAGPHVLLDWVQYSPLTQVLVPQVQTPVVDAALASVLAQVAMAAACTTFFVAKQNFVLSAVAVPQRQSSSTAVVATVLLHVVRAADLHLEPKDAPV